MGLWDDIVGSVKKVVKVCDEEIKNNSYSAEGSLELSIKDKLIEKSLLGVRKYYNAKIDMVNKVSDIETEWYFFDEVNQEIRIHKIIQKVDERKIKNQKYEKEIKSHMSSVATYLDEIQKLQNSISALELENKQSNLDIINKKKNIISEKSNSIKKLEEQVKRIEHLKKDLMEEISEINEELLFDKSLLLNKLEKCRLFAADERINNVFSEYGLECLEKYVKGDFIAAKESIEKYFALLEYKVEKIKHPILLYVLAQKQFDDGNYKFALELMLQPIKLYPDNKEMHEFLKNIHYKLGYEKQYRLENKIVELLS